MSLPPGFRVVNQPDEQEDGLPPGFRVVQTQDQQAGANLGRTYASMMDSGLSRLPVRADALPRFFNFADEIVGIGANVSTRAANFFNNQSADPNAAGREAANLYRERVQAYRDERPLQSLAEEGAALVAATMATGGLAGGSSLGAAAARFGASRPMMSAAGLGAAEGAVAGAGAGQSAEERLRGAALGGTVGAATGGALAGAGTLAGRALGGQARRAIPEIDQLQAAKQAAYQQVDDLGARYARPSVDGLFDRIRGNARQMNINPSRHPAAASTMDTLESVVGEGDVSLTSLDQLRQVIRRDVAASPDPAERAFGQMMIETVDEYIQNSGVSDMVEGTAGAAANAIMSARSANQRFRKSELVADAIERARLRAASTGSGGNEENAIRQNLRRLVEPNSRTRNFFNEEERELILRAVEGDTVQNALRLVSRFAPSSGGLSAILGVGGAASVPQVAVPAMMIGESAKRGAALRQGAMIDDVERLIRTGSSSAPPSPGARATGVGAGIIGGAASSRVRAEREEIERMRRLERQYRP